jgi:hypothetical protein
MNEYVSKFDGCVYTLTQSMAMENGKMCSEDKTLIWRDAPCGLDEAWENNIPPTEFVGFYYGEPNEEDTEYYIKEYWKTKVVDKNTDVVEKKPDVVAELPICFVNMIAACLTTIQEHDLLDLVYGKFASVDEKETVRDDLETVLREFCDVLQELDEDTIIMKK